MSRHHAITRKDSAAADEILQLVSFELGGEEYGVDVLAVREIIRMPAITKVPNVSAEVEGVFNLRGSIVSVISLRNRFGLGDREYDKSTRILVMDVDNIQTGFVVDAVAEVIRISSSEIQAPPTMIQSGGSEHECITGVLNRSDRLLLVLDVDRMFTENERDSLAAAA